MQEIAKKKKELNLWPHAIVGAIIFIIVACAWTVKIALDNPVQFDQFYLAKYDQVDANINEIRTKQQAFDARFEVKHALVRIPMHTPTMIPLQLIQKQTNLPLEQANITLLVTRPDTNAHNQEFHASAASEGVFMFGPVEVDMPGRWQLLAKIEAEGLEGFISYEVFASQ